jgi:predicted DNA-binding protein (MmcQ/YjbR family)
MKFEELREYLLSKKGAIETFPFGEDTFVYKAGDKIFAITSFDLPLTVNLKCDPELAIELREKYEEVQPGYHMNKKHWNTVSLEGRISLKEIKEMIDRSYELIIKSLSKNKQKEFLK